MQLRTVESLAAVAAHRWNALVQDGNPFLSHEFLLALERTDCLGERTGWFPRHLLCHDDEGRLLAAVPLYLKDNSFGEFVFDWSWADAYQRHGLSYYPKLVSAIPFTPATGQRLLIAADAPNQEVSDRMLERVLAEANRNRCSSVHWLFVEDTELARLESAGYMARWGCQFHWHNCGYRDFDDFLATFNAKKRKNIKRERRAVQEAGIELRRLLGSQVSTAEWSLFHRFYLNTFQQHGNFPALTLEFFLDIGANLGDRILLVIARRSGKDIAAALSLMSDSTLYGRHWGCATDADSLHFEACYYQGIEHCIEHRLRRFEPGAQGEHKVWRGFLPTLTRSAHWIAHPSFSSAIADFLRREAPSIKRYASELNAHSPYRQVEADG
ncbi:MAG: GNAT family N-acetyltransferase [Gammaproteobacteria bacterium]